MTKTQITQLQKDVGTVPDGFWGRNSQAVLERYLEGLMPRRNPWPKSDQGSLQAFYGSPGDTNHHTMISFPASWGVRYDGVIVTRINCHKKVADSLRRIIERLSQTVDGRMILAKYRPTPRDVIGKYAGVYNNRKMRGGNSPSLHARAAAIDLDPASNGNKTHWPARATMPLSVMEEFAKEGWLSAGAFWNRDAMHFQATQ